ncbi:hypothetical protein H8E88_04045 [candidate division KSB1 bacterium]|nr:hypothetical protein [candidate division KSB1 bacterium]
MEEKIINIILRLKFINLPFLIVTSIVLYFLLSYIGKLFHIDNYFSIWFIIIISIIINPPLLFGFFILNRIWRWLSFIWKNYSTYYNRQELDFYLLTLQKLSKLKATLVFWSKKVPKSILNAHVLASILLGFKHQSSVLNPTDSAEEDAKHKHVLVAIRYSQGIMDYVKTFIFDSSNEHKEEVLNKCLDALPSTILNTNLRKMVLATHLDGEGFLSTLFALYDLYLCLILPTELQSDISNLFTTVVNKPNELGWLGHRFFEYIVYRKGKGENNEIIKEFLTKLLQLFEKEKIDLEQKKYYIRNELVKNF